MAPVMAALLTGAALASIGVNLAFIGSDFTVPLNSPFEPSYMRALFTHGYDRARGGFQWAKAPPL